MSRSGARDPSLACGHVVSRQGARERPSSRRGLDGKAPSRGEVD